MLDADRPILTTRQDRLGRSTFAHDLAHCLLDHKNPESIVIGLYGDWGSGKTSLMNLTIEELRYAGTYLMDDEVPIIISLNPWDIAEQNQLPYQFILKWISELKSATVLNDRERIIEWLETYALSVHQTQPVINKEKSRWYSDVLSATNNVKNRNDVTQIKNELNKLLRQQKHKIIFFIDNISDLGDDEIHKMFQLIKSMTDFDNTMFVLSLNKKRIVHAIHNTLGESTPDYLEKLIQLSFEIPSISRQEIETLLLDRLDNIIALIPEDSWDKEYWSDLYYSTLRHFFGNCRDITRYVNTLSFSFNRVRELVNPVDFFIITAIQIFSPHVFAGIRDNKDLFTDLANSLEKWDNQKIEDEKIRCDEILNRHERISLDHLKQLLIRLFPRLRGIYQPNSLFYHSESLARKNKRICSIDLFDAYFRLTIPSGFISDSEMHAILELLQDEEAFALALMRLNHDNRIIKFLDLLDSHYVHDIPLHHIHRLVDALFDSGDLFPEGEDNLLNVNTPMRIHRILHQVIQRLNVESRQTTYINAIRKSNKSLYITIHELQQQSSLHSEINDTLIENQSTDFTIESLEHLKNEAVSKIREWAAVGRLQEHPKLLQILIAWKAWGEENESQSYVRQLIRTDAGLIAFLSATLKKPINDAYMQLERNPDWHLALANIEEFIAPTELVHAAKRLFEAIDFEKLREKEQLALMIFLDLINADTLKMIPKTTV